MEQTAIQNQTHSPTLDALCTDMAKTGNFSPKERATLIFLQRNGKGSRGEILLIEKKRGMGKGKYNGPGGKVEPGESFAQAAVRECREEVGLHALKPQLRGRLYFSFADGYTMYGEVFWCYQFSGRLQETEEARPFWNAADQIPYHNMWEDDYLWLPHARSGRMFSGYFSFDGDTMLQAQLHYDFEDSFGD